jgi:CRP-like cAMP-binding protein
MSLLDNINLLASLSQEQKQQLSIFCQSRSLEKGEVLFYQGDEATAMYFLTEGALSIDATIDGVEKHL